MVLGTKSGEIVVAVHFLKWTPYSEATSPIERSSMSSKQLIADARNLQDMPI
jgi:hypothetical protein